jgi:hypothetical protein
MEPFFVNYFPMIALMGANHFILILSINLNFGHNSLSCKTLVTLRDIHGVSKFLGKTISFSKQCCTQMLVHSRVEEIFMFESSHTKAIEPKWPFTTHSSQEKMTRQAISNLDAGHDKK